MKTLILLQLVTQWCLVGDTGINCAFVSRYSCEAIKLDTQYCYPQNIPYYQQEGYRQPIFNWERRGLGNDYWSRRFYGTPE